MSNEMLLRRRQILKAGLTGAGLFALGRAGMSVPEIAQRLNISASAVEAASIYIEAFPTSPLILNPFTQKIENPAALVPVSDAELSTWKNRPTKMVQDSNGGKHQFWPGDTLPDGKQLPKVEPLVYQIKLQQNGLRVSDNPVLPINSAGQKVTPPANSGVKLNPDGTTYLPLSTVWGFNGGFPGPRINTEYGRPVVVRFENHLDEGLDKYPQYDYGSGTDTNHVVPGEPKQLPGFLVHLHNGHTAPESDGNPNYRANQKDWNAPGENPQREGGYIPGDWVDNLYLNYPAGGDDRQKQSFFWFHDHYHNHTGADVYKGMVGLFPIYDPGSPSLKTAAGQAFSDDGDETKGVRLPGVRSNNADGSFDVKYDIPFALYDVRLDDGMTPHKDFHNGNGETHPEWWGHKFFRHLPNHGFVGDIFTVNGTAYPVMYVEPRRYRLRFLDASISRIYKLQLMSSKGGPKAAKDLGYKDTELQGQYRLPDGQQCMRFMQVASDGGLLPRSVPRDTFELWPAKRREFVVDFSKFQDGKATFKGAEIYMVNIAKMPDGRMPTSNDPNYKVPMMKFVVMDDPDSKRPGQPPRYPDNSAPVWDANGNPITLQLRPQAELPADLSKVRRRTFTLERGSAGGETEWLINGQPFDPAIDLADPKRGSWEVWEIKNGGGGWVHPFHLHMEEHRVLTRNGVKVDPNGSDPENNCREDVVALGPSESVVIARQFRTFLGKYVAHCHNLAHEDHNMMFGWKIT